MVKGKKKKKDLDFQKVKLKVGRRLKRDIKETKAEFTTRKIVLKEVRSYSDDPIGALLKHSDHISYQGKMSLLNHFNSALKPDVVQTLNKPIIDSLSKFVIDNSGQVRSVAFKCLKTCFNHLRNNQQSTKDFVLSLKPYLDCAYTHVSKDIALDCHKFMDYLCNSTENQILEPLMSIMLGRYEAGNLSQDDKRLAAKLKLKYLRFKQKTQFEEELKNGQIEPIVWSNTNCFVDLDDDIHDLDGLRIDPDREFALFQQTKRDNIIAKYLEIVEDVDIETSNSSKNKKQNTIQTHHDPVISHFPHPYPKRVRVS